MADYKLGFFGEEIDLKLQEIAELRAGVTQLQQNNETITAAIERINVAIEALQNASTGAVRHIQRGEVTMSTTSVSVELSGFSDLNKMIVLLNGAGSSASNYELQSIPRVGNLTLDTLTIVEPGVAYGYNQYPIGYQVIEFY